MLQGRTSKLGFPQVACLGVFLVFIQVSASASVLDWGTDSAPGIDFTSTPDASSFVVQQTFTNVNSSGTDVRWTLTPYQDLGVTPLTSTNPAPGPNLTPWVKLNGVANPAGPDDKSTPVTGGEPAGTQNLQISYLSRGATTSRNDGIKVTVEFFVTGTSTIRPVTGVSFNIYDIDLASNDGGTWSYVDQITDITGTLFGGGSTTPVATITSAAASNVAGLYQEASGSSTNGATGLTVSTNANIDNTLTDGNVNINFGVSTLISGFSFIYNNRLGNVTDLTGATQQMSAGFNSGSLDSTSAQVIAISDLQFIPEVNAGHIAMALCVLLGFGRVWRRRISAV